MSTSYPSSTSRWYGYMTSSDSAASPVRMRILGTSTTSVSGQGTHPQPVANAALRQDQLGRSDREHRERHAVARRGQLGRGYAAYDQLRLSITTPDRGYREVAHQGVAPAGGDELDAVLVRSGGNHLAA